MVVMALVVIGVFVVAMQPERFPFLKHDDGKPPPGPRCVIPFRDDYLM